MAPGPQHSSEPTLVDSDYQLGSIASKNIYGHNWVPDPSDGTPRSRTLVLCFDGTGDQFDDDNSNIVQLFSCLKKDSQSHQLVYYQPGIGTYTKSSFISPLTTKVSKVLDEMLAWNLQAHVQEGYEFLMQNYTAGDKIAIFGFSRGAYTARALAGMIQKVGLLPPYNHAQVPFAWTMYTREDEGGLYNSEAFKKTFSTDVIIDFVGVWDTVASVGLVSKELPFVGTNNAIRVFRHAISLDEHRVKFIPSFYKRSPNEAPREAEVDGTQPVIEASLDKVQTKNGKKAKRLRANRSESQMWEDSINSSYGQTTDALEVWFAGCHCDVGGGSVKNGTRNSISRIPLRWMIRECFKTNTGIIFDRDILRDLIGIDANTLYPVVQPRPPRIRAPLGQQLVPMPPQPSALLDFLKVIGGLIAIPFEILYGVLSWPIKHFFLLLKFTGLFKKVRKSSPWKAIKGFFHREKKTTNNHVILSVTAPLPFKSEEDEEFNDAIQPVYDQLALAWFWWILEILPFRFREQKGKSDDFFVVANLGRGRKIYGDAKKNGIKVHRSVKTRLETTNIRGESAYTPRAWFNVRNALGKKTKGPIDWNVDKPDPKLWEWVD